jgi:hypothetical protein
VPAQDGHAVVMPHLAPPDHTRRLLLRQEVGRFRARESRRVFDTSVHVGELGGERTGFVARAADLPAFDAALRLDVACTLVEQSPPGWRTAWMVRAGTPQVHDLDLQWLSAMRMAFAVHGRELDGCYVLTRTGWRDAVTDESRVWARLRL